MRHNNFEFRIIKKYSQLVVLDACDKFSFRDLIQNILFKLQVQVCLIKMPTTMELKCIRQNSFSKQVSH